MQFTDEQKLIITMLTEIHAKLGIDDGVDTAFVQEAVTSGHGWALQWQYPGIFHESSETPAEVRRVCDVLEMWEVIERSVAGLSAAERAQVEQLSHPIGLTAAEFRGYSGNDEDEFSIVGVLVEQLGRFSSFRDRDFNAHMPMVEVYDRMLGAYQVLNPLGNFSPTLSVADLAAVLREQVHPDNR